MRLSMNSKVIQSVSQEMFSKFIREIQGLTNSTRENAMEVPWELLKYIDTLEAEVCCVPVAGRPKKGVTIQVEDV